MDYQWKLEDDSPDEEEDDDDFEEVDDDFRQGTIPAGSPPTCETDALGNERVVGLPA